MVIMTSDRGARRLWAATMRMDEAAFHEAGHAVAAAVLGTPIKCASLSGVTTLVKVGCPHAQHTQAIIALSGPAAEDRHRRYSPDERDGAVADRLGD